LFTEATPMDSLDFWQAPSLVSGPFEYDTTIVVRHIWLHFSWLQSAEWHAHVTFIPRSALAASRRPRGIMELTRSWKHIGLTARHCASHVKRTYDVLLHAGSSTASATIMPSQSIKFSGKTLTSKHVIHPKHFNRVL